MPSGTVYPTLGRLKKSGLVKARWEDQRVAEREGRPRRRYYDLTGEGALALAEGASRMAGLASQLEAGLRAELEAGLRADPGARVGAGLGARRAGRTG
jgi:DNA-binding PadR family transcriptional regulator